MSALGQKQTSLWQQFVRKTLHAAGDRCLDGGEIAPGRAWLGRDHLDPNNEDGRDYDEDNGQRLTHLQPLSFLDCPPSRFPTHVHCVAVNRAGNDGLLRLTTTSNYGPSCATPNIE